MSSSVFKYGVPVVDKLEPKDCSCVLRAKDRSEIYKEVYRIAEQLTKYDRILVYPIGLRPDRPVPTSAFFAEVKIEIGYTYFIPEMSWWNIVPGQKEVTETVTKEELIRALHTVVSDCNECGYHR